MNDNQSLKLLTALERFGRKMRDIKYLLAIATHREFSKNRSMITNPETSAQEFPLRDGQAAFVARIADEALGGNQ